MAGTGVKLFLSGEVALASDINTFLMDQAITRFANPTDRDSQFGDGIPVTQTNPSTGLPGSGKPELSVGRVCFVIQPDPLDPGIPGEVQVYTGTELGWQAASEFNVGDGSIGEAKLANGAVTSSKILDGTIVNADISPSASIALSKLATGSLPSGITISTANLPDLTIETTDIADGAVTSAKLSSSLSLTGTTSLEQILEKATVVVGALSSPTNLNALSGAVYYSTASTTSNITLNLRGNDSTTLDELVLEGKAFSCVFMITSGSANGKILTVTAGSSTVNLKWFGGNISPSGSGSGGIDVYTITAIKTNDAGNGTFTIFISQSKFA